MQTNGKPKRPPKNSEPVESLGEVWYLSEVTAALQAEFAQPVRMRARQALLDDRPFLTEEQYQEEKEEFQTRIDRGDYTWGPPVEMGGTGPGRAVKAVLETTEGMVLLIRLLLREAHDDVPLPKVAEIMDGNPEGVKAALVATMGLPPLPPPDPKTGAETGAVEEAAPATSG